MKITGNIVKHFIFEILMICGGLAAISILHTNTMALTLAMILIGALMLKFWHKKLDILFFVTAAIIGPIGEIVSIQSGVWNYSIQHIWGIPLWLPLVWGFSFLMIKRVSNTLSRIEL
ncbi:MAG: hypothetical protein QF475_02295 [Candidatus Undinarchaeales archaeon]|jgi:hypothetical protein|nr:hypothetical protein [Candidatus Undinarchaeales archaeon]